MLVDELGPQRRVAIVTYAGNAGTALEPTPASQKQKILGVIDQLGAGGSTAGAEGIRQAYALAEANLDPNGVNRVILATDGDFNVGITNQDELKGYVERERGKGVFLSVLGLRDGQLQRRADADAGAERQRRRGLHRHAVRGAKDLGRGSQLDPVPDRQGREDPGRVQPRGGLGIPADRLRDAAAQSRRLQQRQGRRWRRRIGTVGDRAVRDRAGRRAARDRRPAVRQANGVAPPRGGELGFVKIRYKLPKSDVSRLISTPIDGRSEVARFEEAPQDARFAIGVAAFAEMLRGGKYSGTHEL